MNIHQAAEYVAAETAALVALDLSGPENEDSFVTYEDVAERCGLIARDGRHLDAGYDLLVERFGEVFARGALAHVVVAGTRSPNEKWAAKVGTSLDAAAAREDAAQALRAMLHEVAHEWATGITPVPETVRLAGAKEVSR